MTTPTTDEDRAAAAFHRMSAECAEQNAEQAEHRAAFLRRAATTTSYGEPWAEALRRTATLQEAAADAWREAAHTLTEWAEDREAHARGER